VKQPIKSQSIVPRIDGIQRDVKKRRELSRLSLTDFGEEDNFIRAQFYLGRAMEGVFHIGAHLFARLPGGRATEYKTIALKLGEVGIVPQHFAEKNLKAMAGYRNRLTHFYADITRTEIYRIVHENLDDFSTFLKAVKELLSNPDKLNLTVE